MKEKIIRILSAYFYPQNVFAKSILRYISTTDSEKKLIDAPCGNGETSQHFAKNKNLSVFGYDLNDKSIANAKKNHTAKNLNFETANIFDVMTRHTAVDYFCIINSLFLLPEPDRLLREAKNTLKKDGRLFVIIPNVEGKNFKWFSQQDKDLNKLLLNFDEITPYFKRCDLEVKEIKPIAYTHNYGRKDVFLFSVFSHFYLSVLNFFQTNLSIGNPNYFLIVSSRVS
jgi:2-polyprenyl-3-methyl-5-hydroxy-6-metoxy-1,4-benzoquinol methylase